MKLASADQRSQGSRHTPLLAFVLGLSAIATAGCLDTHTGLRDRNAKPAYVSAEDKPREDHWTRVFVGSLPRPKHNGYLRSHTTTKEGTVYTIHYVYDTDFQLVGTLSENGRTARYLRSGKIEQLGILTAEEGCLAIYGYTEPKAPEVRFVTMPAPK